MTAIGNTLTSTALCGVDDVKEWLAYPDSTERVELDQKIIRAVNTASQHVALCTRREFICTGGPNQNPATRTFSLSGAYQYPNFYITFGRYDLDATQPYSNVIVTIDTDPLSVDSSSQTVIPPEQYEFTPIDAPNGAIPTWTGFRAYTFSIGPVLREAFELARQIQITGNWGFAEVPQNVVDATALTAIHLLGLSGTLVDTTRLTGRTNRRSGQIPDHAYGLLQPYIKIG